MSLRYALFAIFLLEFSALAGVLTYRDENGTLHAVSSPDEIPEQYRGKEKKLASSDANPREASLKLERDGNSLLIPVSFGPGNEFLMVLDTGASVSMISKQIADKVKPKQISVTQVATASGVIPVPVVEMPEVSVRAFTVKNMKVTVNNLPPGNRAHGLLGVDFLNHFRMQLDTETGQLHLEKK